MSPFDREVRAQIYHYLSAGRKGPTADALARERDWPVADVSESLGRLADQHLIVVDPGQEIVTMAHPFSGVATSHRVVAGERSWFANCAWDALAILALMGDGIAIETRESDELAWEVRNGQVSPGGIVHVLVPARDFWTDIGFT
jgi:hypothetical protein